MELETDVGATLLMGLRGGTAKLPEARGLGFNMPLSPLLAVDELETPVATDLLAAPSGILCTVSWWVFFSSSVSLVTEISAFFSKSDFSL